MGVPSTIPEGSTLTRDCHSSSRSRDHLARWGAGALMLAASLLWNPTPVVAQATTHIASAAAPARVPTAPELVESSAVDDVRRNLEATDPLRFLLNYRDALALRSEQVQALQRDQRDMADSLSAVLDALDRTISAAAAANNRSATAASRDHAALEVFRMVDRLADIQDTFRTRARHRLSVDQRVLADACEAEWLATQRKRIEPDWPLK